jgi:rubrerythrin
MQQPEIHFRRRINMPVFGSPFSGSASDRKLTDEELIRAIRFMVAAEYEATQLFMQLAESTDNKLAAEVLKDIADEERVHAGEFLRLLHELAHDEEKFYAKGAGEVEEQIEKMKPRLSKAANAPDAFRPEWNQTPTHS